jgi:hypothetical protein
VLQKETEKRLKYKNLSVENEWLWYMKCFVMSVIIGPARNQRSKECVGQRSVDPPQNAAALGKSLIIWKVLQCELETCVRHRFKKYLESNNPVISKIMIMIIMMVVMI